jgi:hypothetical protein
MSLSVIAFLLVIAALIFIFIRKKAAPPPDISDSEKLLKEVDILMHYGKSEEAIKVLKEASLRHGNDQSIQSKLKELQDAAR